jgi:hypothetical protein
MARRPLCFAAISVVPLPQNGSSTSPFAYQVTSQLRCVRRRGDGCPLLFGELSVLRHHPLSKCLPGSTGGYSPKTYATSEVCKILPRRPGQAYSNQQARINGRCRGMADRNRGSLWHPSWTTRRLQCSSGATSAKSCHGSATSNRPISMFGQTGSVMTASTEKTSGLTD